MKERFGDSLLASEGWINSAAAMTELDKARRRGSAPKQLWYLYVLEEWLRRERGETLEGRTIREPVVFNLTNGMRRGGAGTALQPG